MARALLQASMPFVRSSSRAFSASTGHPGSGPRLLPRFPSPLTYPGAKTFGIQAIHDVISKHFDLSSIRQLVSPFFGGGSLELALQHKYPHLRVFGNDLNLPLVCFWKACKKDGIGLHRRLHQMLDENTERKALFDQARERLSGLAAPPEDDEGLSGAAADYFLVNRMSFKSFGHHFSATRLQIRPKSVTSSLQRVTELDLQRFDFHSTDFQSFLDGLDGRPANSTKSRLLYLDPPYVLGKKETFDHTRLRDVLSRQQCGWVLSYNNCATVRQLYADMPGVQIIEVEWNRAANEIILVRTMLDSPGN